MRKLTLALCLALASPAHAAVSSTSSYQDYTANGSTTAFAFTFPTLAVGDVEVLVGGVKQLAGVTVTLNANQATSPGGTATFTVAPANLAAVRVQRTVALTQGLVLQPYSAFPAKTVEKALDRIVMQAQQLERTRALDKAAQEARDNAQDLALSLGEVGGNGTFVTATGTSSGRTLADWAAMIGTGRVVTANRSADALLPTVRLAPCEITRPTMVNRVSGYVAVTDATGKLMEIGIYGANLAKIVTSEVREVPAVGEFEFALPETTLQAGRYYVGVATNSVTAQFGVGSSGGLIAGVTTRLLSAVPSTTGGSLAAGTRYYKVTALGSWGESFPGNELVATTTGVTASVALAWEAVTGATGYRVYRGGAAGGENVYYELGAVTSYTDVAAATTGGTPPTSVFPLPSAPASTTGTPEAVQAGLYEKSLPQTQGLFLSELIRAGRTTVRGRDSTTGYVYGINLDTNRITYTSDGDIWTDLMTLQALNVGESVSDMVVSGGKLYMLTNAARLFVTSGLAADSTWTDISAPAPAIRHTEARGRPYAIAVFNGYLWQGEYSETATGEFSDGPRILRYEIATGTWVISKQFTGTARHIHAFAPHANPTSALWVSTGDASYGADVGIHRIVPGGIVAGGPDTWTRWTNNAAPFTNHYVVNFVHRNTSSTYGGQTAPAGMYGASDRPGKHIMFVKDTGSTGNFNQSAQAFQPAGGDTSETVRSLVFDEGTKNIFYFTAETDDPALYVSPPPYTQAVKLTSLDPAPFMSRAMIAGNWILIADRRFKREKFTGQ